MDRSTSLAALTRLHLRKRGHWRRLNIMCNKERREEVWAARPATLAFVPAPATAAPLTPPPGWSVGSSISPRFLQSPHCSGVVEAVSCRRGHGVVVTTLSPNRRNSSGQGKSVLYIVLLLYNIYEPNAVCWPERISLFLVTSSSCKGHSSCASAVKF